MFSMNNEEIKNLVSKSDVDTIMSIQVRGCMSCGRISYGGVV